MQDVGDEDDNLQGRPCPLCRDQTSLRATTNGEKARSLACSSCGARWELKRETLLRGLALRPRAGAMRRTPILAKLVDGGNTEAGKRLQGEERPLAFWRRMSGAGRVRRDQPQVIREIIKMRCKYCGTIYDMSEGKCTHCGAPP